MKKINTSNVLVLLKESFPEFINSQDYKYIEKSGGGDLPYVVFGTFFNYYVQKFLNNNEDLFIERANNFLEEMATCDDSDVIELLEIGFLDNLSPVEPSYSSIVNKFSSSIKKLVDQNLKRNRAFAQQQKNK